MSSYQSPAFPPPPHSPPPSPYGSAHSISRSRPRSSSDIHQSPYPSQASHIGRPPILKSHRSSNSLGGPPGPPDLSRGIPSDHSHSHHHHPRFTTYHNPDGLYQSGSPPPPADRNEARRWHKRAYGSRAHSDIHNLMPHHLGHAAAYQAYKIWKRTHTSDPSNSHFERHRDVLTDMALKEVLGLYSQYPHINQMSKEAAIQHATSTVGRFITDNVAGGHHEHDDHSSSSHSPYMDGSIASPSHLSHRHRSHSRHLSDLMPVPHRSHRHRSHSHEPAVRYPDGRAYYDARSDYGRDDAYPRHGGPLIPGMSPGMPGSSYPPPPLANSVMSSGMQASYPNVHSMPHAIPGSYPPPVHMSSGMPGPYPPSMSNRSPMDTGLAPGLLPGQTPYGGDPHMHQSYTTSAPMVPIMGSHYHRGRSPSRDYAHGRSRHRSHSMYGPEPALDYRAPYSHPQPGYLPNAHPGTVSYVNTGAGLVPLPHGSSFVIPPSGHRHGHHRGSSRTHRHRSRDRGRSRHRSKSRHGSRHGSRHRSSRHRSSSRYYEPAGYPHRSSSYDPHYISHRYY